LTEDELAVVKKIDSYTPKVNPKDWAQIETFVRDAIRDAEPDRYSTAQPWLSCVSQLVMWSWKVECLPLERDVILEPANIFAYVEQRTGLKDASQATTRAILLNISKRLLGENAGATEDRRTYANRAGRTPYTSAEKIALRSFVRGQATDLRRRNVRVIIALGAGAGLTAVDLMLLMPEHIEDQGDQILVHVPGDKPRTVPLIAEWEDLLRDSMVGVDRTMPLVLSTRGKFRYGNAIADFLYSCNGEGVRPHCQRLRSTWFVDQLNARTPLNVVLEAAGVTEVSTLGRYLKFLAPVQAGAAAEFLRLGDSA
jgi:integrase